MKYILQKSCDDPLWWVVTDTEEQLVCRFREGDFNGSQKHTMLNDIKLTEAEAPRLAAAANGIAEWLRENHYELLFSSPTEIKQGARKSIGEELKSAREDAGYTLRDLAKMTGIAFNHIGRIEKGQYNVTLDTLALLADALGMEIGLCDKE